MQRGARLTTISAPGSDREIVAPEIIIPQARRYPGIQSADQGGCLGCLRFGSSFKTCAGAVARHALGCAKRARIRRVLCFIAAALGGDGVFRRALSCVPCEPIRWPTPPSTPARSPLIFRIDCRGQIANCTRSEGRNTDQCRSAATQPWRPSLQLRAAEAAERLGRPEAEVLEALQARARLGSTALGRGVALPHAQMEGDAAPVALFARLRRPVEFDARDEEPADLVILVLWPEASPEGFLPMLAETCRSLREPQTLRRLRRDGGTIQVPDARRGGRMSHAAELPLWAALHRDRAEGNPEVPPPLRPSQDRPARD